MLDDLDGAGVVVFVDGVDEGVAAVGGRADVVLVGHHPGGLEGHLLLLVVEEVHWG